MFKYKALALTKRLAVNPASTPSHACISRAMTLVAARQQLPWQFVRSYSCQIQYPTKLDQLRAKFRGFGSGHIELDIGHAPGLALLTLANGQKHNALTGRMMAELADCVDLLEATCHLPSSTPKTPLSAEDLNQLLRPESGLVLKNAGAPIQKWGKDHIEILNDLVGIVVTGEAQKSYCAGLDLSAAKGTLLSPTGGAEMAALMVSALTRFTRLPLLSIAAIEKAAIGGGAEMTTICDHRCLSQNAKVHFVQTQMGVVTGWGGASRLLNIVSRSQALRLLAGGEPIKGGSEAMQMGFAQATAPVGEAVAEATKYMGQYVWEKPPTMDTEGKRRCVDAVRSFKKIVSRGTDHERVENVSEMEKDFFKQLWGGPDNLRRVKESRSK
ncbi:enoyl CoA hydratase domain-containing protein 1 [Lunasporangiospora selenospora]|uniref:Enoyl CoA hydratase domain-containing protein 1 n=1 Tax=Lunasporangiospora selenospora TaxID=979761 RepID=A0A9P6KH85_9FUNG|nr:enoyl CoA hydratase domain-containing protein 1 [Lunasporangiospora selenospora]